VRNDLNLKKSRRNPAQEGEPERSPLSGGFSNRIEVGFEERAPVGPSKRGDRERDPEQ